MPTSAAGQPALSLTPNTGRASSGRVLSIDALRGFDMFWIIGADALVEALGKMAHGNPIIAAIANQLDHVPWEGLHFYDLIFPLFVFIVGVSLVFSLSKRTGVEGRSGAAVQVFRRFLVLYLLGIFAYGGIDEGFQHIRLLGVLQRIALCYLFASLAFLYLKPKGLVILCASILIGYWAILTFVPVPGIGAGNFAEGLNFANYVDREFLPLRKWDGDHDPEGLLSTLPAIASCLLGVFAGMLLRRTDLRDEKKVTLLLVSGIAAILVGLLWSVQFPIIKKIWTSSYVLVAAGFSALFLALFYWIIDIRKKLAWAIPFIWIGTNAITIYMLVHVVRMSKMAERFVGGEIKAGLDSVRTGLGDLMIACVALALGILFCRFCTAARFSLKYSYMRRALHPGSKNV